ncbi:NADPH:quinone reductase [Deinococcus geothermalis DSM 11300]|uniref:NADPH:quinone reductase n=1 Tax=Deinococcus geothermalis (strain DSM 11300 / CIP 105573 / AG-3a) TaxID=319795 RepID=Q1J103_DEIGD|nr:zinc-binding dehydrogenase [Deinococcus geothermalis]ABF44831.1 NADPH:quinone reductase [Deinococcus geothermalis DSM 11300]
MSHAVLVEQHGGPEVLSWRETPLPVPGPGQVRVRVSATSVNYADIQARRGGYDAGGKLPFTPGLDACGTVDALGEGVTGLRVGERVACFPLGGSYATHVLAPAHLTFPLENNVPDAAAASLTALVTAYNVVTYAGRLQRGETVLIHASAGGVGHLAVQIAREQGAGQVVGVVGSDARVDFLRHLGVDEVVNRHREDFVGRVNALTEGRGADLILDSIGGTTTERGFTCLAPFGRLVIYGHAGRQPAHLPSPPLHRQSRAVIGYSSGHHRQARPQVVRDAAAAAFALAASGAVRIHVAAEFPLMEAARAHALVESGEINGRVLLTV